MCIRDRCPLAARRPVGRPLEAEHPTPQLATRWQSEASPPGAAADVGEGRPEIPPSGPPKTR
eukprot:1755436-Alexandrium_andersonii.AAC.1